MSALIDKGVEYVKKATELDKAENYQDAFDCYTHAIEYFISGLKYEKNPKRAEIITQKVGSYMSRAEELKKYLDTRRDSEQEPKTSDGDTMEKKPKSKGKKSRKDEDDDAKLSAAIAEAIVCEKPNVHWSDVAGQEEAKKALNEAVVMPLKYPQLFEGNREPWRGILLYGPPGTGKSYIAKAVATETDCTFFSISANNLMSKWQGESENLVATLFKMAREQKPSVIFLDEVDALVSSRSDNESESSRRIKTTFLTNMDGVGSDEDRRGVLVLAATNIPWGLDSAIRRRFQRRILIDLPEMEARERMFKIHIGKTQNELQDEDLKDFAEMTEGFSSDDVANVVRDALMEPVRCLQAAEYFKEINGLWYPCDKDDPEGVPKTLNEVDGESLGVPSVTRDDFMKILAKSKPSVGPEDLIKHKEWAATFGTS